MKILWALVFVQFCVGGFLYGMVTAVIKRNAELSREMEALRMEFDESQIPWKERR